MESGSLKGTTIGEHSHCTGGHSTIKQYHERFQKNAVRWCPFFEDEKWEKFYSVNSPHLPSGNTRFMPWYSDLHVCSCLNMGHHRDVYFKINLFINFTDPCFEALISKLNVCTCESCFIFISREWKYSASELLTKEQRIHYMSGNIFIAVTFHIL